MTSRIEPVLELFRQLSAIPRCSRNEAEAAAWSEKWAAQNGFSYKADAIGNRVIYVPASPGYEHCLPVVIQGHYDMVCEKTTESTHDFTQDPLKLIWDGEWLKADGTSLGADNGIALALAMALAQDSKIEHPPLELLFTVDEETGLTGAKELDASLISGRILINLDSENEGIFTVGCAGGHDATVSHQFEATAIPENTVIFRIVVNGLNGGHSGVDIGRQRANANHVLVRFLDTLLKKHNFSLLSLEGGTVHNAIPRSCTAVIAIPPGKDSEISTLLENFLQEQLILYKKSEPQLNITATVKAGGTKNKRVLSPEATRQLLDFILAIPHGVYHRMAAAPEFVETSNNLARVRLQNGRLKMLCSQRSNIEAGLSEICNKVEAIARLAGTQISFSGYYAPWQPQIDSDLVKRCQAVYQSLFQKTPTLEIMHAGLECAIIGERCPGMEMISLGPTIRNPHSPDERMLAPSIEKVWDFLVHLLASYKSLS